MADWKKITTSGSRVSPGSTFIEGGPVFHPNQDFWLSNLTGPGSNGAGWETLAENLNGTGTSWINGNPQDDSQPGGAGSETADSSIINGYRVGFKTDGSTSQTYSGQTGPNNGPAYQAGLYDSQAINFKYLFSEASGTGPFDFELITPQFNLFGRSNPKLIFYGHAWGTHIGTLTCTFPFEWYGVVYQLPLAMSRAIVGTETEDPERPGSNMTVPFVSQTGATPGASATSPFLKYEIDVSTLLTVEPPTFSRVSIKVTTTTGYKGDFAIANVILDSTEPESFPALVVDGAVVFPNLPNSDPGSPSRLYTQAIGTGTFLKVSV